MPDERPKYDAKLALILRTAAAVFADKGFHQASIRDISRATGVSLSGLYYYVRSKEELLFLIQDRCFGTLLEEAERLVAGGDDPHRRLYLFVECHLRYFAGNMKEMKVLSHEAESLSGELRRRVQEKKRRYTDLSKGILESLAPDGGAIDLRIATFSLFGMLNWLYTWYRPERDVAVGELAEHMSQLFLRGYLAGGEAVVPAGEREEAPGEVRPSIWGR